MLRSWDNARVIARRASLRTPKRHRDPVVRPAPQKPPPSNEPPVVPKADRRQLCSSRVIGRGVPPKSGGASVVQKLPPVLCEAIERISRAAPEAALFRLLLIEVGRWGKRSRRSTHRLGRAGAIRRNWWISWPLAGASARCCGRSSGSRPGDKTGSVRRTGGAVTGAVVGEGTQREEQPARNSEQGAHENDP